MAAILSQKEVDALLRDFDVVSECSIADELPDENEIVPYDLLRSERCVHGKIPAIEAVNARFCHTLRQTLSINFRQPVDVQDQPIEIVPFKQLIRLVEFPTAIGVFQLNPLVGKGLLICERRLSFALIDILLGGLGHAASHLPNRDFTPIELRFLEKSLQTMLLCLENAWEPMAPLHPRLSRLESKQQFINIPPSTSMLVTPFHIIIRDLNVRMMLCISQNMIEPIRSHLNLGWKKNLEEDHTSKQKLENSISKIPVKLTVELGQTKMKLRDFLKLKVGDYLPLTQSYDEPLNALVENIIKFRGTQGALHGHLAFKINERIQTPKDQVDWIEKLLSQRSQQ